MGFNPRREAPPRATTKSICLPWSRRSCFNPWREAPPRATSKRVLKRPSLRSFNPWREAPPRATNALAQAACREWQVSIPGGKPLHEPRHDGVAPVTALAVSIPGGKPLHEPLPIRYRLAFSPSMFQSLAGSPSTSHPHKHVCVRVFAGVSIPGGKPLHEPPKALSDAGISIVSVSIPGGKPLHEPRSASSLQSALIEGFNPWREAPPRATLLSLNLSTNLSLFQSLAGSPSTSHITAASPALCKLCVSIPGGKPLHEPLAHDRGIDYAMCEFQSLAGSPSTSHTIVSDQLTFSLLCFNPWREAPPRATVISLPLGKGL